MLAEYWGQFVQMRNDIAIETEGNGEIAFESVNEDDEDDEVMQARASVRDFSAARSMTRDNTVITANSLATEEESMTYANNGSSVYVPQQGKVRFHIIPAAGEELVSATLDGEDIMPYIEDGVYTATADKKNAKLVVKFTGTGQEEEVLTGDTNDDGIVNGTDIQTIINLIVAGKYDEKADINKDNIVNGTDIQEVINIIVNAQ